MVRAEDGLLRASILDFRGRLANRCKVLPVYALLRASILDFRLKLENRCRVFPGNAFQRASILDFMPRLANRCSFLPGNASCTAVILDLRGSIWESLQHHRSCSEELPACSARRGNELPRPILIFVAAKENGFACNVRGGYDVRVRFYSSLPQREMVPPAAVVAAAIFRIRF